MQHKITRLSFFASFLLLNNPIFSETQNTLPQPMRIEIRHIEANGVGYNQGYSTLEGFFAPGTLLKDAWIPFLDLRGHVFNNGRFAANTGIGCRYLDHRIWGINAYYDYRNTNHSHYNQISLGLESLGTLLDFRINGYLPVGKKTSSYYDTKFAYFEDHYAIISSKYEFAMKSANAEIGFHVDCIKQMPIYVATGPYYLQGQGQTAWGGQVRARLCIAKYFEIEGNTSYDNLFRWIGQGQIGLSVPFGKKGKSTSKISKTLITRAWQKIDRNEIIPTDHKHSYTQAINPLTQNPYYFVFVNNESHSKGTWNSPYATLSDAQTHSKKGDIIYLLSGNSSAYEGGIQLKDGQKLWGAASNYALTTQRGTVKLTAHSKTMPQITNSILGIPAIFLADNNEVAGLNIDGITNSAAILGENATNTYIYNNTITNVQTSDGLISLTDCTGTLKIINNTLTRGSATAAVSGIDIRLDLFLNSPKNAYLTISDNTILNMDNCGIFIQNSSNGSLNSVIENNTLSNNATNGIYLLQQNPEGSMCSSISRNTLSNNRVGIFAVAQSGSINTQIINNSITNSAYNNVSLFSSSSSSNICLKLYRNMVANPGFGFYDYLLTNAAGNFALESSSFTTGTLKKIGTIVDVPHHFCNCRNLP